MEKEAAIEASDRPRSLKAQQGAASQREIVAAAMRLIERQGFFRTSMAQIAAEARLTKGAVYWHFRSKEELGLAVLDLVRGEFVERVLPEARGRENALERIELLIGAHLRLMLSGGVHCGVVHTMAGEIGNYEPGFADSLRAFIDEWAGFIERLLERGKEQRSVRPEIRSAAAARSIIGAVSGAYMHARLFRDSDRAEELIGEVQELVRRSIAA